jgi:polysaccharide export outer membrane protein
MTMKYWSTIVIATTLLLGACSTPKDVTYFQDATAGSVVTPTQQFDIRIKPDDKLSIIVNTQDVNLSTIFNLVQSQTRLGATTSSTRANNQLVSSASNGYTGYYTVTPNGDINFPIIGDIHIAGMNRSELASYIETQLSERNLVKDAVVTVEFANMGVSIIGEVKTPGRYEFNKDRLNLIDALAMAGDLSDNAKRTDIMVMRENGNGAQSIYRLDLTHMDNVITSPAFYLQQNDVIYVGPNNKKKRETTANGNTPYTLSFWVSLGSFAVTIATLITTLTD